jgi:predicted SAM-dependent methyltransferase
MLYNIRNPSPSLRIFYDASSIQRYLQPHKTLEGVELVDKEADRLRSSGMVVTAVDTQPPFVLPAVAPGTPKPAIVIDGMWGIGDNLHQRAVVRELMKTHEVWLSTCHWQLYHDLVADGLHLIFKSTRLRAQGKTIERERHLFKPTPFEPAAARRVKLWYKKDQIDIYGSILETMMAECGLVGKKGDFSLPIPAEWSDKLQAFINFWEKDWRKKWNPDGKPVMIYRPVVRRREWNGESRNPDSAAYAALYAAARSGYFVVSIADLEPKLEWIVGDEQPADIKLHSGELDFETMAALFSIADIGFFNAGFAPVLAQAVGLPSVVVYGGRESFRTTQAAGAHLAPTLGIDPVNPCDCHTERHPCDKRIDMPPALDKVREFVHTKRQVPAPDTGAPQTKLKAAAASPVALSGPNNGEVAQQEEPRLTGEDGSRPSRSHTLIFATTYVDSDARQTLTEQWLELTSALNPDCPLLLVDSASPLPLVSDAWKQQHPSVQYRVFDFGDNVGHLSRGGKDGWGRAFSKGLEIAVDEGYTYVAHIEGDSLLRLPVDGLIDQMLQAQRECCTTKVSGMKKDIAGWIETGLMVFKTTYVRDSGFIQNYNWRARRVAPTPEIVIANLIKSDVFLLPIKAVRGDKHQITHNNVLSLGLDWITHCHNDVWATDRFFEAALAEKGGPAVSLVPQAPAQQESTLPHPYERGAGLLLNLGCGTNKLSGWLNHDADVDVTKPLPWNCDSAYYIFIEHCIEHLSCHQAIGFFEEAFRVLSPGGVLRVVVPSVEQIANTADQAYFDFTKKFGGDGTLKGALKAILFSHGHQMAWTASVMSNLLRYAGFEAVEQCQVGISRHSALRGVEGHGRVIGDKFNRIESMCFEATKPGRVAAPVSLTTRRVALVVGGSERVKEELAEAEALCAGCEVTRFVINDMIPFAAGPCIAVSLHPTKLADWLRRREANGHPAPSQVWAHRSGPNVTHHVEDWAGSSGLFSVKIARKLGFERIILCGVPMEPSAKHVVRAQPWPAAVTFRRGWEKYKGEIAPFVRSMSGWTAEMFGRPVATELATPIS